MRGSHATVAAGAACTALSIEFCYIPHRLLDGGTTGMVVVAARLTHMPPVYLLLGLNLLMILIAQRALGTAFVSRTAVGFLTLGLTLHLIKPVPPLMPSPLAAVLGGLGTGLGTALVLQCGGALDGSEVIGQLLWATREIPIVWSLLAINTLLFALVIGIYGLEPAFYSLLAQAVVQLTLFLLLPRRRTDRPRLPL